MNYSVQVFFVQQQELCKKKRFGDFVIPLIGATVVSDSFSSYFQVQGSNGSSFKGIHL